MGYLDEAVTPKSVPEQIDALSAECYRVAVEHGWWDEGVVGRDALPELEVAIDRRAEIADKIRETQRPDRDSRRGGSFLEKEAALREIMQDVEVLVAIGAVGSPRSFGDLVALMHTELSEALEEFRDGHAFDEIYYPTVDRKPEGIPVELADVLIRIFDFCGRYSVPLGQALVEKMRYNEGRPFRHGGKAM